MKINDIFENVSDDKSGLLAIVRPSIQKLLTAHKQSKDAEKAKTFKKLAMLLSKVVVDSLNVEDPEEIKHVIASLNADIKKADIHTISRDKLKDYQNRLQNSFYTL